VDFAWLDSYRLGICFLGLMMIKACGASSLVFMIKGAAAATNDNDNDNIG